MAKELYIPIGLSEELEEEQRRRQNNERIDAPINFFGHTSQRLPASSLGIQPDKGQLLREVKGWAWIAGSAIARRIRGIPMEVFVRRKMAEGHVEDELLQDHILKAVLDKPNPVFSGGQMRWLVAWHMIQTGEAYWQKIRDGVGVVREFWPLPPQNVDPVPNEMDVIGGYMVTTGKGEQIYLQREDVVRFWNPDPYSLYSSIGTLGPMSMEWDATRYMEEHLFSHFQNDASPRVVITGREGAVAPTNTQKADFNNRWKHQFNRRDGSYVGVPAFIPSGFDVQELSSGGAQELVPLQDSRKTQFMMAYGVPPSIVGDVVDANRAAAETNYYVFDRNTVQPLYDVISEAITEQSAKPDYDEKLLVKAEDFVSPDKDFNLRQEAQDLATGTRSVQQVIRDRGGDPDEASWGELPILSAGMAPYTGDDLMGDEPNEEGAVSFEEEDPEDLRHAAEPREDRGVDHVRQLWTRVVQNEKKYTSKMQGAMLRIFEEQRKDVIRILNNDRSRADAFNPRNPKWKKLFDKQFQPIRSELFVSTAEASMELVNPDEAFTLTKAASRVVERQGIVMARDVNRATLKKVQRQVSQAAANGEGIGELTKRVNKIFKNRKRARTIARTELLKASQAGQLEGFRKSGVVEYVEWNTALDGDVRDSHASVSPTRVVLGEDFMLGSGAAAEYPGDPRLDASDVVNCRCFTSPVVEDE